MTNPWNLNKPPKDGNIYQIKFADEIGDINMTTAKWIGGRLYEDQWTNILLSEEIILGWRYVVDQPQTDHV